METELISAVSDIAYGPFNLTDVIFIIILLLLLFSSAVISGSEVAYFSLSPGQLEEIRQKGYEKVCHLHRKPEKLLATILISNNFVNVAIVILSSYLVDSLFDFSGNPLLGFVIQVIVVTFIILLFGEIIPKLYANRSPIKMAIFMASPLTVLSYLFRPLSALLINSTSIISKKVAKKDSISIDQLSKALELTKDSEINEEKDILEGIVRFSNIYAIDIIQPRINIIAIDEEDSFKHIRELIIEHGYSRLPVYKDNLDTIVGILYIKDLLAHLQEDDHFQWQSLIRPAYFVPETKKINDLLEEFQTKKVHLAIVVDEYGGTSGIVTMEDILEEIVGEINDETDEKEKTYIKIKNNAYIFEGHTLLNDFEKIADIKDDYFKDIEGEADTLAGLILEIKGELPRKNEVITYRQHKFTILDVDKRRIKKIKYEDLDQETE
ncbi:gliding motility-associated protein GldE [Culturomica massiliensis]|uniref:gliding motility-associated protein GldE n=1 Tax=Culturomica massiliensis TaxID=1841857 RepID=UPI000E558ECB|nr:MULTISPECIES: gliding motility-associated protein GldE [Odoribacteraceae]RHV97788.1 gliding motility-associated protein GldE [Odoribacter sp. OF09-27XD]